MLDREAILDRIRRNLDEVLENKRISEAEAAETSEETDEEETK
jgi:hypothetical protein